jgi:hypothetical protein
MTNARFFPEQCSAESRLHAVVGNGAAAANALGLTTQVPVREVFEKSTWPTSRSQEKKWSKKIRQRLADLVSTKLAPARAAALAEQALPAQARTEGEQIFIDYKPLGHGTGYVRPSVLLEFGARSTGTLTADRPAPQEPLTKARSRAQQPNALSFDVRTVMYHVQARRRRPHSDTRNRSLSQCSARRGVRH